MATCCYAALGRLADFLSLSLLFCEIEIIEPVHRVVVKWFVKWVVVMFVKWDREVKCYLVTKYGLTCANDFGLTLKKQFPYYKRHYV